MRQNDQQILVIVIIVFVIAVIARRARWMPSSTAFGTAHWATEKILEAAGMLGELGIVLGRTLSGKLIRIPSYCHILLIGSTGSGKGVGIIIPNLLKYFRGSAVCFETQDTNYAVTAKRRKRKGQRILRVAPFNGGKDKLNVLDTIPDDSPLLFDHSRSMAESLATRGTENDQHWHDKAVQVITALLVYVLSRLKGSERNLNSLQEIASDPMLLFAVAEKLQKMHGIAARMGSQIKGLFEKPGVLSKEGSGVLSTVTRHLSFLDSEMVARSVESSTFDVRCLLEPSVTLYLQIPPEMLEAAKGLLRCWVSTIIRVIGSSGSEETNEVLLILDEASALGGLTAVEESLVRGRAAGCRILLAYQSDSQVRTAFKDKPTLIYDNCDTQIYMGGANSYETAERLSTSLGDWTQMVEGYSENTSRSWNEGGYPSGQGQQVTKASTLNYSVNGRALLRPEEILRLGDSYLITLMRGMPPILAKRIKWYKDPEFNDSHLPSVPSAAWWWLIVAASIIAAWFVGWRQY
jgi:type IV secretion system protein VirD4